MLDDKDYYSPAHYSSSIVNKKVLLHINKSTGINICQITALFRIPEMKYLEEFCCEEENKKATGDEINIQGRYYGNIS